MTRCRLTPPGVGVHSNPFSVVNRPGLVVAFRDLHDPPPDRTGRLQHFFLRCPEVKPGGVGTDHPGDDHLNRVLDVPGPAVVAGDPRRAVPLDSLAALGSSSTMGRVQSLTSGGIGGGSPSPLVPGTPRSLT